jgi:hypothetical protein
MKLQHILIAGFGLIPVVAMADPGLVEIDCRTVGYLATECNEPFVPTRTRAAQDVDWTVFKTTYNGGLTAEQLDGIARALNAVLASKGTLVVYSFDNDPASGAAGFTSAPTSVKGFYRKPVFSDDQCVITFGSAGSNGSMTCGITAEYTTFGVPPAMGEGSSNYTMVYADGTMSALQSVDPNATPQNFNIFVSQIFSCMNTAKDVGDGGSGCVVGDNNVGGVFGKFKMSPTTGNWSFSGSDRFTYVESET